jgi:beta-fructofuranosidase
MNKIFYKPKNGVCADFIPLYDQGHFKLYFLEDYRNVREKGEGTPWMLTSTDDFVSFSEEKEVISRGQKSDQDLYVFTGSVLKDKQGLYHAFYTGHNPYKVHESQPQEGVMHAVSPDGIHFTKIPDDTFFAPEDLFEKNDWRDPFVYYDGTSGKYRMLLAARLKSGPKIRRGCTGMCVSDDLTSWKVEEPLWSPTAFYTHECPDFFRFGIISYLVFSEYTDKCMTRYRYSLDGKHFLSFADDVFDGRAFYAAKTASDGQKRYIFGWIPTKKGNDHLKWNWGGNLVVHEVFQRKDLSLGVKMPSSVISSFTETEAQIDRLDLKNDLGDMVKLLGEMDGPMYVEGELSSASSTRFGILLDYSEKDDRGYLYSFAPQQDLLSFNAYPNMPWNVSNFINVNRHLPVKKDSYKFRLLYEDNIAVLYVDDEIALSSRMYPKGKKPYSFGLMVSNGSLTALNLKIKRRP